MPLIGKMGRWKAPAAGGFDPLADISWDVYFNASLITGLVDNDSVIAWNDESGNANDATQSLAGLRGVYKTSIINGKPVVRFAGDGYSLTTPFYRTTGWTAFHVMSKPSSGNRLCGLGSTTSSPYSVYPYSDGRVYIANRSNHINVLDAATTFDLWTVSNTSGNVLSVYKNGSLQSTIPQSDAYTGSFAYLGYRDWGAEVGSGDMAHVSCSNTTLSTVDREAMDNYLGALYAKTITH